MKSIVAAFISAFIFGIGLALSGMTLPSKVIGFLDITGSWDPSLLAVMMGAILIHSVSYLLIKKRQSPLLVSNFHLPTRRDIDWRLILGATLFGAGWGLGGFCPGPALVNLVTGHSAVLIFFGSMVAGIFLYQFFNDKVLQRKVG